MPRIQVLPPGLVNQIAAGEVVERPASVVKELVENALDAGASAISVEIEEGGLALVRVADDGCGMEGADAALALERHATSKLRDAAGLSAITTMGFRGEALPAIASVSRLRLETAAAEDGQGKRVVLEGGGILESSAIGRARGTTVEVRDLFFNTPARRKFMRSAATEAGHVTEAVVRLALARTDLSFTLRSGGRLALSARGGEPIEERASLALGREARRHLLSIEASHSSIRVHGVICSPDHSEATARALYLFVNGRWIRDRSAAHAVLRAFAGSLPAGRHPAGILFLELAPGSVDVNVHPQKHEVRFSDAREVQDAVYRAVSGALRSAPWLGRDPRSGEPCAGGQRERMPLAAEEAAGVLAWGRAAVAERPFGAGVAPAPRGGTGEAVPSPAGAPAPFPPRYFGSLRYIGQHARTYLLCEAPGGALVVVDQHASHERLLFHRLRESFAAQPIPVQPFLVPQIVSLPAPAARALEASLTELARVGLDIEPFGGDAFAVKGAPAALGGVDLAALLGDLAGQLAEAERPSALDTAYHALLATMACHAAVRANQTISTEEAMALLEGLDGADFKGRCPHGRPIVFELQLSDLERRVGRR